jgi:glycerol-3-phosphate dehydrogenase (NAD(P)+)
MAGNRNTVAVLGAGTWGIVLAQLLHENGHGVSAWDFYAEVIEKLKTARGHPRMPGFSLSPEILLTSDIGEVLRGAEAAVLVVPSLAIRGTCEKIRELKLHEQVKTWAIASKGIEPSSLKPLNEVVVEVLGEPVRPCVGVLSGPTHAEEVARKLPATLVAAAENPDTAARIQQLFFNPFFRVYTQDDVLGVELGAALKNVIAIAAGVSDGFGFGDNTRAALITRGLAEIMRLGVTMGARRETFMGLSGLGDLVVTTSSVHSRNHRFGELLAEGKSCEEALKGVGMVVEGYATAQSAHALAKKFGVEMPISEAVYRVCYEGLGPREALQALLARGAKSEKE